VDEWAKSASFFACAAPRRSTSSLCAVLASPQSLPQSSWRCSRPRSSPVLRPNLRWVQLGCCRASDLRWVEIHDVEGAGSDALYHISVLRRLKTDPVWNLKHVVAHMAITAAALSRSVAPVVSHMGTAYPEAYEEGYKNWLGLRKKGGAPICDTSVMECAHL
jgi:hypothetical protein